MKYELISPAKENSQIIFEPGAVKHLAEFCKSKNKVFLVADSKIYEQYRSNFEQALPEGFELINFDAGDQNKNIGAYQSLLTKLVEAGCDRHSIIVSFGGGVVSDIAGFVASSYMRGIDWVAVPSTLMAQADAAIGGKTGINLGGYKNLVGSFWPPAATLIDPVFLKTLEERELKNGLAEVIKMGLIYDKTILDLVDNIDPNNLLSDDLSQAAMLSAKAKIEVVNQDMHESGGRKIVNFGHTIGHAVEAISLDSGNRLLHGEAIAIGMVGETKLAALEGKCGDDLLEKTKDIFTKFGLPISYSGVSLEQILEKIALDKKNSGSNILWTLPTEAGKGSIDNTASKENITKAIEHILS